jgi:hypothetical protein
VDETLFELTASVIAYAAERVLPQNSRLRRLTTYRYRDLLRIQLARKDARRGLFGDASEA